MDIGPDGGLAPTFGEASKLLPVGLVLTTIVVLYMNYVFLHCMRLLQTDLPEELRKAEDVARGQNEMIAFHCVTAMLLYCLARCILTDPGRVPDGQGWELKPDEENAETAATDKTMDMIEKKHTGERRHCKWCLKYKPDRCHHCRVCGFCVLKMDHYCPWVYNCIGFRNHKYFFLLLVYAAVDLMIVNFTMFDSVWWSTRIDVSLSTMFVLIFAEILGCFLMVLITGFLGFHIWLMLKAMTTVEFCEKALKKASYNTSIYSLGTFGNICAVLGPNPMLWLLPVSLPEGDGLTWGNKPGSPGTAVSGSASEKSLSISLSPAAPEASGASGSRASLLADDRQESGAGVLDDGSRRKGSSSRNQPQVAG